MATPPFCAKTLAPARRRCQTFRGRGGGAVIIGRDMASNQKLIAAVLLAAGAGKRFGGEKLLHPLEDGVAIAAHAARNLLAVTPEVTAVVRWGDFPLYEILEQEGCQVTMFKDAAHGMGASLAHGISQA